MLFTLVFTIESSFMVLFFFSGVLKDFLRELPEPLFTNALYQMLLDALSVRLPGDPDGSAKLMLSVLECLPKANQVRLHILLTQKCDVMPCHGMPAHVICHAK